MKIWLKIICVMLLVICVLLCLEIKNFESPFAWKRYWYNWSKQGYRRTEGNLHNLLNEKDTKVILILGQSNAANYIENFYIPKYKFYNYYQGKAYVAKEPLMGCSGNRGSLWTHFADKAFEKHLFKNLILITIAEGDSKAEDWAYGKYSAKLKQTLDELYKNKVHIDYVFWYQGESENPTTIPNYLKNMTIIRNEIAKAHQDAPFICAITSFNKQNYIGINGIDTNLQNAQKKFILACPNVLEGPNTDKYIYALDRYDGQHLSSYAANNLADDWVNCLTRIMVH